jgi:hypothetical protein
VNVRLDTTDEFRHPPVDEPHWSESWYFDAVSDDGGLGVYTRTGLVAGRGTALFTAAIVRPGGETILVVDADAALPDDPAQTLRTSAFVASQECLEPLRRYRVRVNGTGRRHADRAAPLRAEAGDAIEIALDLHFETDGTPYRWQLTSRYEIPCRVTGTVTVDGVTTPFAGPGQRDHSWGPRDWWGHEWMWSAFHFEDGTRTHAVTLSDLPGLMVGYVQRDGRLIELSSGSSTGEQDEDGLVRSDRLVHDQAGLTVEVRPTGFGPLRLVSDAGKVAWFTRAMAEAVTSDGVRGVGWIEWNRVRP